MEPRSTYSTNILIKRLEQAIALRGTTAKNVAAKAGIANSYVSDILTRRSLNPGYTQLLKIAAALDVPFAFLVGEVDDPRNPKFRLLDQLPILAQAKTGAFAQLPHPSQKFPLMDALRSRRYPDADHFAVEVADLAMDQCADGALTPGMVVKCVSMASAQLIVESDRLYVIRMREPTVDLWQTLIRRAYVFADRTVFSAESSQHYDDIVGPTPVAIGEQVGQRPDGTAHSVVAVGLVYGFEVDFL